MSLKQLIRGAFRLAGLEVHGARGGVYLCRAPHAGHAVHPSPLPSPCRIVLRRTPGAAGGRLELDGAPRSPMDVADFARLPILANASVDAIRLVDVYEYLFRHERRSALLEWRRVLKPGGTLVVRGLPDFDAITTTYVKEQDAGGARFDVDEVFARTHGDPATVGPAPMKKDVFTQDSVVAEMAAAGFEIVSREPVRRDPEPVALWFDVEARRRR